MTLPEATILCPGHGPLTTVLGRKAEQSVLPGIFIDYFSEIGDESHPTLNFGIDRLLRSNMLERDIFVSHHKNRWFLR